jgi:hypothetical protein
MAFYLWSNVRDRRAVAPNKCHIVAMKNDIDSATGKGRRNGSVTSAAASCSRDSRVITLELGRRGAKAVEMTDSWIDELQWLAGFPGSWGEPRRSWFGGF